MLYGLSRYSLFPIIQNKINLSFSLSITRNFIFFLPINQPTFPHPTSPLLSTNQPTFLNPILCKLGSLITLQCPTKDGSMGAIRSSIHIAYHFIRNGGVVATRSFIYIAHYPTKNGNVVAMRLFIYIAHHSTKDGNVAATRPSIYITHHLFSLV